MSVKLVILDLLILAYSSDIKPQIRMFMKVILGDLNKSPHFKISFVKCSNLEYDYKWILRLEQKVKKY